MTTGNSEPFLKYAIFCQDTEEDTNADLTLKGVIDLVEIPAPEESAGPVLPVLAEVDAHLVFCIVGASPGLHHLLVAVAHLEAVHQQMVANQTSREGSLARATTACRLENTSENRSG